MDLERNRVEVGKTPGPAPPLRLSAARSPRLGNGGRQPCAPSPGDPQPPSADATAGPGTPARDPGPSPAPAAESAALRGKRQVSREDQPTRKGQPNSQAPAWWAFGSGRVPVQQIPSPPPTRDSAARPLPHPCGHCCAGAVLGVSGAQSPGVRGVAEPGRMRRALGGYLPAIGSGLRRLGTPEARAGRLE